MSVTYSARALIGCRFSGDKLFTEKRVKAFDHSYTDAPGQDDMSFCPKTGRPLWRMIQSCLLDDLDDLSSIEPQSSLGGLYCFDNAAERSDRREILVGLFAVEQSAESYYREKPFCALQPEDFAKARDLCQKVLQPLGLWREDQFGIHVMMLVSC